MADLKGKAKQMVRTGQDLAGAIPRGIASVPQAYENVQNVGSVLDALGKGAPMPNVRPAEAPTLADFLAMLDTQVQRAKGYYRGYIEPKVQRTLRDLFY